MAEQFATLSSVTTMLLEILSLSSFGVYISTLPNHKQMDLFKKVINTNLLILGPNFYCQIIPANQKIEDVSQPLSSPLSKRTKNRNK